MTRSPYWVPRISRIDSRTFSGPAVWTRPSVPARSGNPMPRPYTSGAVVETSTATGVIVIFLAPPAASRVIVPRAEIVRLPWASMRTAPVRASSVIALPALSSMTTFPRSAVSSNVIVWPARLRITRFALVPVGSVTGGGCLADHRLPST